MKLKNNTETLSLSTQRLLIKSKNSLNFEHQCKLPKFLKTITFDSNKSHVIIKHL